MTPRIAFFAPMKPPDHPVPSGDRSMARALIAALADNPAGWPVDLVSRLRTRDGAGDAAVQARLIAEAAAEAERLARDPRPWAVWVTYHSYWKAPDLIGPAVARARGIPYVQIEASRARSRLCGPWARFAAAAEAACDAADAVFHLTARDAEALERDRPPGQRLVPLAPFLDRTDLPPLPDRGHAGRAGQPAGEGSGAGAAGALSRAGGERPARPPPGAAPGLHLLAVAMMRDGDKRASYAALAAALAHVRTPFALTVAGDGPARDAVAALLAPFAPALPGALGPEALARAYAAADLLTWPGINEAFGMVYLEAQAHGLPVVAEDRPGIRDVVQEGGVLTPPGDPRAYAAAIDGLIADPARRAALGTAGRAAVAARHLRPAATATLWPVIAALTARAASHSPATAPRARNARAGRTA